jgi:formylglycine-generating enzyme required for sulfatase activity
MTTPSSDTLPRIFVSHNHQDNAYCREFVLALRKEIGNDEAVWYDEDNLGWGKLRREIDRELAQRQHFIAILSPTAVASDWVNDEIDAAIELRRRGSMQTIQFVIALPCEMPPLLSNYKRVVLPDGQPFSAVEAAHKALAVIRPTAPTSTIPAPLVAPTPTQQPQPRLQMPSIASNHLPQRLASLGFTGYTTQVNDKLVEYIVPPLCDVPAGPFLMDDDKHSVTLPAYQIARYPVTVAEYACFVRAGYAEPVGWQTQLGNLDHPVVSVSWHDATAYAAWLVERTGQPWRLPSEAEWEKAARGSDGREYPWGNHFDQNRCNTHETGIGGTTPVGSYVAGRQIIFPTGERQTLQSGASPYEVEDLAGNVWEWTESRYDNSTENRVLRGGSWNDDAGVARAAYRDVNLPVVVDDLVGFRLVCAAPISG